MKATAKEKRIFRKRKRLARRDGIRYLSTKGLDVINSSNLRKCLQLIALDFRGFEPNGQRKDGEHTYDQAAMREKFDLVYKSGAAAAMKESDKKNRRRIYKCVGGAVLTLGFVSLMSTFLMPIGIGGAMVSGIYSLVHLGKDDDYMRAEDVKKEIDETGTWKSKEAHEKEQKIQEQKIEKNKDKSVKASVKGIRRRASNWIRSIGSGLYIR